MSDSRAEEGANLVQNEEFFNSPHASHESLNSNLAQVRPHFTRLKHFCFSNRFLFIIIILSCSTIGFSTAFGVYFHKWKYFSATITHLRTRLSVNTFAASQCPLVFTFTDINGERDRLSVKGQNWTQTRYPYDPYIENVMIDYEKSYTSINISIENCEDNLGFNHFELIVKSLKGQNERKIDLMEFHNCSILWFAPEDEIHDEKFDLECWETAKTYLFITL